MCPLNRFARFPLRIAFLVAIVFGKDALLDKMEPIDEDKATDYLAQFGYAAAGKLVDALPSGVRGVVTDVFKEAVKSFQEFASLPVTGVLDVKTRKKMAEPRCGMQDNVEMLSSGKGPAFKWRKNDLTYAIHNFSPDLAPDQTREAIRKAFGAWAEHTPLTFREVNPSEQADINIKFASKMHDDPWPFDGKGGVLAHATMPPDGKLHFDEAENWVFMDAARIATLKYTDLLPVAIHEGGHALGLSHSRAENSIMAPFYQETADDQGHYKYPRLQPDDVRAIQEIYGPKSGTSGSAGRESPAQRQSHGQQGTATGQGGGDLWKSGKKLLKQMFINWLQKDRK